MVRFNLLLCRSLGNFVRLTLLVTFGRDNKSLWSRIPGVYARGSKRSHTGGKCVNCRGLEEWWSLSLTHRFYLPWPERAHERHRAGSVYGSNAIANSLRGSKAEYGFNVSSSHTSLNLEASMRRASLNSSSNSSYCFDSVSTL